MFLSERTLKMTTELLLQFFPIYRNLRDNEVALICKLHNDTQLVTSHCLMSFEKYGGKTKKPY